MSFYVALFSHRDPAGSNFFDRFAQWPLVRKIAGEVWLSLFFGFGI
jgi:hypothetical protein